MQRKPINWTMVGALASIAAVLLGMVTAWLELGFQHADEIPGVVPGVVLAGVGAAGLVWLIWGLADELRWTLRGVGDRDILTTAAILLFVAALMLGLPFVISTTWSPPLLHSPLLSGLSLVGIGALFYVTLAWLISPD